MNIASTDYPRFVSNFNGKFVVHLTLFILQKKILEKIELTQTLISRAPGIKHDNCRMDRAKSLYKKTTITTLFPYLNMHQATIGIYIAFPNPKQTAILVQNYDKSCKKKNLADVTNSKK